MAAPPDEPRDREKVNQAVHNGLRLDPLRSAGTADNTAFRKRRNRIVGPTSKKPPPELRTVTAFDSALVTHQKKKGRKDRDGFRLMQGYARERL
jgi:hypothetical protein